MDNFRFMLKEATKVSQTAAQKENDNFDNRARCKEKALAQAKDRAQLTATTAMSIVNVTLLKELLDQGSEGNKYYTAVLWLISLSLALQVFAGVVHISITHIKDHYEKYGDDPCNECLRYVCCVRLGFRTSEKSVDDASCLPCYVTTEIHPACEYKALRMLDEWNQVNLDTELRAVESRVVEQFTQAQAQVAEDHMLNLHGKLQRKEIDEEEYEHARDDIERNLAIERQTEQCVRVRKDLKVHRERGRIIAEAVRDIRHGHFLKTVSFWQGLINYALYFVFIFNIFIAGLGLFGT